MSPLETYLTDLRDIRATGAGVAETSFYPALANLLNEIGRGLKPKVRCVMNLADSGAGLPDGGLFTADQFQKGKDAQPKQGQPPARGALEAKGPKETVKQIARSEQVVRYCGKYGLVLVTNYREFLLLGRDASGKPGPLEGYTLAGDERGLWAAAAHPQKTAKEHGAPLCEFLKRVLLTNAPLSAPRDLAWFMASYARDALFRVERQKELPALQAVRTALEEALGMKFTGEKGEHFFRSTLVQTLFYGVFSAWVRWHKDNLECGDSSPLFLECGAGTVRSMVAPLSRRPPQFDWRTAEWSLHVPFIRTLYEEVAKASRLGPLGLVEVLNWAAAALNRVDRDAFFRSFEDEHAVQYFYEPFLEAYDPELRKALGVWYTPREIVKYQVARVDRVLREELDLPDGLADPNVIVLDPCCGTGAYLVEVLHTIAATLRDKGGDALVAADLKRAAMERVFGFEIMPAPFVVSHLQLGLLLQAEGAPLSAENAERVGVYLTNALTGWEPPKGPKQQVMAWAELQEERDAAEHVKRDRKILVVLGNPPYNGFAGVALEEERSLTTAYRTTKRAPSPEGQGLNDLYVRFYRMAEHRIAEMSGEGIVCFISNYSWLDGRSHNGMRERFLEAFDCVWIDCLNGDKYKTGKTTPDGAPDPSVFSTQHNREGIQVGTAIGLLARKPRHHDGASVLFRHFWGAAKLGEVLAAAGEDEPKRYEVVAPQCATGLAFVPSTTMESYYEWPQVPDLLPMSFPGVQSKQDALVIDIDEERLRARITDYFDAAITHAEMATRHPGSMDGSNACEPFGTRAYLIKRGIKEEFFVPYLYKPFDKRWIYWEPETNLLGRKSPDFFPQVRSGNRFLEARRRESISVWSRGAVTSILADNFGNGFSNFFPLVVRKSDSSDGAAFLDGLTEHAHTVNLSLAAAEYLSGLQCGKGENVFYHAVAMMHSPLYRHENGTSLRNDWPRVPLPADRAALEASAALGEQIAALLDTEAEVPGVTCGKIAPLLKTIGPITKVGGGQLDAASDLAVTAGWGHKGKEGVTMPAKGLAPQRQYDPAEAAAIEAEAAARGISPGLLRQLLGEATCDVYLSGAAFWRNVPVNVWEYYIGGYQVIKKWLSYREDEILGRALRPEEAREVMNMARRLTAILLLQPALDDNYRRIKAHTYPWPKPTEPGR